jgi:hypothetical protein
MVGSQQLKFLLEIEGNRLPQHKSEKIGPSHREGGINHVLELFIRKTEIKIVLRGGCSCQRLATEFLLSSILNKWERFQIVVRGMYMLFYSLALLPLFLSQTMANRFHRVPTNFHKPWRSAFFFSFFLFFVIMVWPASLQNMWWADEACKSRGT